MFLNKNTKKGISHDFLYETQIELLGKALGYLPDETQDFMAKTFIQIVSVPISGTYLNVQDIEQFRKDKVSGIIMLPMYIWEYFDDDEIIRIILHQIAHLYLKHSQEVAENVRQQDERIAEQLVAQWGFERRDIKECRRTKKLKKEPVHKDYKVKLIEGDVVAVDDFLSQYKQPEIVKKR